MIKQATHRACGRPRFDVERRVGLAIVFAVTLAGLATWQLIATIRLHRDASPLPLATARLAFLVVACVAWIVTARQI